MTIAPTREATARSLSADERALFEYLEDRLANHDLSALGSLEAVADKMVAALPDAGTAWGSVIGPVYTSKGLQQWLMISRQAINQHVQEHRILRLTTADDVSVFPSFQFDDQGGRLPHLRDVLNTLAQGVDDAWTWAAWLNTPDSDGVTQAEKLRHGKWEAVCELAREDVAAWSHP